MCISVRPHIDPALIGNAWQQVLARHDSLTVSFPADANGPVPTALDPADFHVRYEDMTGVDRRRGSRGDRPRGQPAVRSRQRVRWFACIISAAPTMTFCCCTCTTSLPMRPRSRSWSSRCWRPISRCVRARRCAGPRRPGLTRTSPTGRRACTTGATGARPSGVLVRAAGRCADRAHRCRPTIRGRQNQRGPGASRKISIPSLLSRQLIDTAQDQETTLFTVLFTAFNVLLHDLTGRSRLRGRRADRRAHPAGIRGQRRLSRQSRADPHEARSGAELQGAAGRRRSKRFAPRSSTRNIRSRASSASCSCRAIRAVRRCSR